MIGRVIRNSRLTRIARLSDVAWPLAHLRANIYASEQ